MSDNIGNRNPTPIRSAFSIDYLDMRIPTVVSNIFDSIYRVWNQPQDCDVQGDREPEIEYSEEHLELALIDLKMQKASGSMLPKNNDQEHSEENEGSTEELHTVQYESIVTTQTSITYLEHEMSTDITYPAIVQNTDFSAQNNCEVNDQQTEMNLDVTQQFIGNQHEKIVFSSDQSLVNQIESSTRLGHNSHRSSRCSLFKLNSQINSPSELVYAISHQSKITKASKKNLLTRIPQRSSQQNSIIKERQSSRTFIENLINNNEKTQEDADNKTNESEITLCPAEGLLASDSDVTKPVDPPTVHGTGEQIVDDELKVSNSLTSVATKLSRETSRFNSSKKFSCQTNEVLMTVTHSENTTTSTTGLGKINTEKRLNEEKPSCNNHHPQPSQRIISEVQKYEQELQLKEKQSTKTEKYIEPEIVQTTVTTEDASTMSTDLQLNVEVQAVAGDDKELEKLYEEQVYKYSQLRIDSCLQTQQLADSATGNLEKADAKLKKLGEKTKQLDTQETQNHELQKQIKQSKEINQIIMQDKPSKFEEQVNKVRDVEFETLNIRTYKSTINMSNIRKINDEPIPTAKENVNPKKCNTVDASNKQNAEEVASLTRIQKSKRSTKKDNGKAVPSNESINPASLSSKTEIKASVSNLNKNDSNHNGSSNNFYNFYNESNKMNNVIMMSMPYGNTYLKEKTTNISSKIIRTSISNTVQKSDMNLQSKPPPEKMKMKEVMQGYKTGGCFAMSPVQLFVHGQPTRPTFPIPGYCYGSTRYAPFVTSKSS